MTLKRPVFLSFARLLSVAGIAVILTAVCCPEHSRAALWAK